MRMLDCSSIDSARASLASLLGMREGELRRRLRAISIPADEEPVSALATGFAGSEEALPLPSAVRWFHASRVTDAECFARAGILTKAEVAGRLRPTLEALARGLTRRGAYLNEGSASAKRTINDEGPFAFLIRTVAVQASGATHDYTGAPELVEDLSGELLGGNCGLLVERFQRSSKPCIVSFRGAGERHHVARALWYVYLVELGEQEEDAASAANTCYDGEGVAVPVGDIVDVEWL